MLSMINMEFGYSFGTSPFLALEGLKSMLTVIDLFQILSFSFFQMS